MKQSKEGFDESIAKIERIIGYRFRDKSLITQAFTRTSYCNEHLGTQGVRLQSNEVLEFFGDGVLSVAIITHLMKSYTERYEYGIKTELGEGDFSNIKSKLSDKKNLSECIRRLGLQEFLRMGEGDTKLGIATEPSVMEDLFESIVGAVYIDSGMELSAVISVVSRMLDISAYTADAPPIQSSKNALQEWCADKKRRLGQPIYKTLGEEGPDHKKVYERGVFLGERMIASAKGKNLKLADAAAAEAALTVLRKEAEVKAEIESRPRNDRQTAAPPTPSTSRLDDAIARLTSTALPVSLSEKAERNEQKRRMKEARTRSASEQQSPKKNAPAKEAKVADTPRKSKSAPAPGKKQTAAGGKAASVPSKKQTDAGGKAASGASQKPQKSVKNATRPTVSASTELKKLALARKVATPTFKDLGEVRNGSRTEYRIECICMGESATGTGASRPEAKEAAAAIILARLSSGQRKNKK